MSPEYLPGKRAFAAGLTVYHTIVAGTLFGAPRFVPKTFGTLMERYGCFLSQKPLEMHPIDLGELSSFW